MELLRLVSQDVGLLKEIVRACALEVDICQDFGSSAELRKRGEVGLIFLSKKTVCRGEGAIEDLEKGSVVRRR